MKKVFTGLLIITSLAIAQESNSGGNMYVGLEVANTKVDRTFEVNGGGYSYESSRDDKTTSGAIKIGFGKFEDNRLEVSLQRYSSDLTAGDSSQTLFNSSDTTDVAVDYIITMPSVSSVIMPFVKLGVSASRAELGFTAVSQGSSEKRDTIYALGGTVGAGLTFQITNFIDVLAGFDYTYRKWQDISNGPLTLETNDKVQKIYAGLNLRF